MKRLSVLFVLIFAIGCAGFQLTHTEQNAVAKISARHIGDELMKRYPEVAKKVSDIAQKALAENDITAMETLEGIELFSLTIREAY